MAQGSRAKTAGGLTEVVMPQLGESVTEGQISRWLKQPGEHVDKYEALVEVITDKVNAEVPSPMEGNLVEITAPEGVTVAVGTVICTLSPDDGEATEALPASGPHIGLGRAVAAGGMVYVSSIGPIDPKTGMVTSGAIKEQTRQCLQNLKTRLETAGTSLDKVVWANWSLRDPTEFDTFNEEWVRWFPGETPIGQGTLMPLLQRRAGFRISIGVIAEA